VPTSKRGTGRASKVRKGRWSKGELAKLARVWGSQNEDAIAREFERSIESVRRTAERTIKTSPRTGPWTAQEIQRLRESIGVATPATMARVLGRPLAETEQRIAELARVQQSGKWSREELNDLKQKFGRRTDEDLARIFGRSVESVRRQAMRLCLAKDKSFVRKIQGEGATSMPRWRASEVAVLKDLYPRQPNIDIATVLNRSVKSVVSKAHHLGLKKDSERLKQMGRENVGLRYDRQ
jgi:hypothetical protein